MTELDCTAWVITREGPYSEGRPNLYWAGNYWSLSNLEAIRFARRIDALRTLERLAPGVGAFASEHRWVSP